MKKKPVFPSDCKKPEILRVKETMSQGITTATKTCDVNATQTINL